MSPESEAEHADSLVGDEMRAYYGRRAREYDDWWLARGLHAARERPGWAAEVDALVRAVAALEPRRVLDVACGTGFLTRHLRGAVTALDQSPAMLAVVARATASTSASSTPARWRPSSAAARCCTPGAGS